jgi:hypothetical protein
MDQKMPFKVASLWSDGSFDKGTDEIFLGAYPSTAAREAVKKLLGEKCRLLGSFVCADIEIVEVGIAGHLPEFTRKRAYAVRLERFCVPAPGIVAFEFRLDTRAIPPDQQRQVWLERRPENTLDTWQRRPLLNDLKEKEMFRTRTRTRILRRLFSTPNTLTSTLPPELLMSILIEGGL